MSEPLFMLSFTSLSFIAYYSASKFRIFCHEDGPIFRQFNQHDRVDDNVNESFLNLRLDRIERV